MRFCEVCGKELTYWWQDRFCSLKCKNFSQTKEWQLIQELKRMKRVTFIQLKVIVKRHYGISKDAVVEEKISEIMERLNREGKVRIVVGGSGDGC